MFNLDKRVSFSAAEFDVVAVGEILVDIISTNLVPSFKEAEQFKRYFGGSPANISMNLSSLGAKSALITKVGADGIGDYLKDRLVAGGVDTSGVVTSGEHNTSVVLVTQSKESPNFIAYRDAEKYLKREDIKKDLIANTKIIHLSTFALSAPVTRQTLLQVIEIAREQGKMIALDPNYRPQLWEGEAEGPKFVKDLLEQVNLVKPSLDDAAALFGPGKSPKEYIAEFHNLGVELVILTLGAKGVIVSTGQEEIRLDSFAEQIVDTTGAGDAFWSGFYASLTAGDRLKEAIKVGNAASALALQEVGALADLPHKDEIMDFFDL
ncbi:MAG: sugar kinase [Halanaerobacter sp.]